MHNLLKRSKSVFDRGLGGGSIWTLDLLGF